MSCSLRFKPQGERITKKVNTETLFGSTRQNCTRPRTRKPDVGHMRANCRACRHRLKARDGKTTTISPMAFEAVYASSNALAKTLAALVRDTFKASFQRN